MDEDGIDDLAPIREHSDSEIRPAHIRRVSSSLDTVTFANEGAEAAGRPSLQLPRSPSSLSRALTLPHRRRRSSAQDKLSVVSDATPLDTAAVDKLRRWILCIVNGKSYCKLMRYPYNDPA